MTKRFNFKVELIERNYQEVKEVKTLHVESSCLDTAKVKLKAVLGVKGYKYIILDVKEVTNGESESSD
jgi:hypothetical protein